MRPIRKRQSKSVPCKLALPRSYKGPLPQIVCWGFIWRDQGGVPKGCWGGSLPASRLSKLGALSSTDHGQHQWLLLLPGQCPSTTSLSPSPGHGVHRCLMSPCSVCFFQLECFLVSRQKSLLLSLTCAWVGEEKWWGGMGAVQKFKTKEKSLEIFECCWLSFSPFSFSLFVTWIMKLNFNPKLTLPFSLPHPVLLDFMASLKGSMGFFASRRARAVCALPLPSPRPRESRGSLTLPPNP